MAVHLDMADGSTLVMPNGTEVPVCVSCLTVLLMGLCDGGKQHEAIAEILSEVGPAYEALEHLKQQYLAFTTKLAEARPTSSTLQ